MIETKAYVRVVTLGSEEEKEEMEVHWGVGVSEQLNYGGGGMQTGGKPTCSPSCISFYVSNPHKLHHHPLSY